MKVTTSTVRVRGWQTGAVGLDLQQSVLGLLTDDAGFDHDDASAAVQRLSQGRAVEVQFDSGDEEFARAFCKRLANYGLSSTCRVKTERVRLTFPGFEFFGWAAMLVLVPAVLYSAFAAPWTRLLLLAVAVGALLAALVVRLLARRAKRTIDQLERFGNDIDVG